LASSGYSPLHWAAEKGKEDAIELLLRQKAQIIDDRDLKGYPPLMIALLNHRIHTAEILVANGAKFDFRLEGSEAWRWAIKYGEWACAAFLLGLANRGSRQKKTVIVKGSNFSLGIPMQKALWYCRRQRQKLKFGRTLFLRMARGRRSQWKRYDALLAVDTRSSHGFVSKAIYTHWKSSTSTPVAASN
jgi:hypothetical protein